MSQGNKGRGRPQPDAAAQSDPLLVMNQLKDALEAEYKFKTDPLLSIQPQEPGLVTAGGREGATNVLRCLKIWYDLPTDVFFVAVNLLDRFLTIMKVRNRHMACVSIGSLYLAAKMFDCVLNPDDLVSISQSKCTGSDMLRMADVISAKLGLEENCVPPVTAVQYVRIYHYMLADIAAQLGVGHLYAHIIDEQKLCNVLEIVISDSECASERASVVALVSLHAQLDNFLAREVPSKSPFFSFEMIKLFALTVELQNLIKMKSNDFLNCLQKVLSVLHRYNGESKLQHRQRLEWRVSSRTMRQLRPTSRLKRILPTIDEHAANNCCRCYCCTINSSNKSDKNIQNFKIKENN